MSLPRSSILAAAILCILACGGSGGGGRSTGATCETSSTLTYATFGQSFMTSYCTRCHASTISGVARNGAPVSVNLDSLTGIRAHLSDIDAQAAAGPDRTNAFMPLGSLKPTQAEREQLGAWLACDAP